MKIICEFYWPGADVCETPETENKLECVEDALEEEESPELHDGGVDDVHHEAGHVSHLLRGDADIDVGDTLQWITAGLSLEHDLIRSVDNTHQTHSSQNKKYYFWS